MNLAELSLYEVSRKIYPRAVHGWFAEWGWVVVWARQLLFFWVFCLFFFYIDYVIL